MYIVISLQVLEFDTPAKLLADSNTVFANMMAVQETQKKQAMDVGQAPSWVRLAWQVRTGACRYGILTKSEWMTDLWEYARIILCPTDDVLTGL